MRNLKRLECEIYVLKKSFGYQNIFYPADGSWIKILNYRLPQHECRYNLTIVEVLIIIPEAYDSIGISECYVDNDLKIRGKWGWERLPHTHDRKYESQGYQWLCFEPSGSFVSLLDFINTIKLYLNNPYKYQRL